MPARPDPEAAFGHRMADFPARFSKTENKEQWHYYLIQYVMQQKAGNLTGQRCYAGGIRHKKTPAPCGTGEKN